MAERALLSLPLALSLTVAMAVYTNEQWNQPRHPQIQCFFSWSFYLGWLSVPLLLTAGDCHPRSLGGPAGSLGGHRKGKC